MNSLALSLPGFALSVLTLSCSHPVWSHVCTLLGSSPAQHFLCLGQTRPRCPGPAAAELKLSPLLQQHPQPLHLTTKAEHRWDLPPALLDKRLRCRSCLEEMTVSVSASDKFVAAGTRDKNMPNVTAAVQAAVQQGKAPLGFTSHNMLIPCFH